MIVTSLLVRSRQTSFRPCSAAGTLRALPSRAESLALLEVDVDGVIPATAVVFQVPDLARAPNCGAAETLAEFAARSRPRSVAIPYTMEEEECGNVRVE